MTAVATDVHFRVTSAFHSKLSERAAAWGVSRHETCRRLAALMNFGLSLDDHDRVPGSMSKATQPSSRS